MSRILAYTSPARGHLYPIVATLLELHERGHEIHVRTLASEVQVLRGAGLEAAPIASAIEDLPLLDHEAASPEAGLMSVYETMTARADLEIEDFQRAITDTDPTHLLVDVTTAGAAAVAEASGLPWALTIPLFQHFSFEPGAPRDLAMVPFAIAPPGLDVLNGPRRRLGLPLLGGFDEVWRADLNLYFTAPPLERELDFPSTFQLVGPGTWDPMTEAPSWWHSLTEPRVLVAASSETQNDDALIRAALEGLAGEAVTVAASTAAHDPASFDPPANAHVERWLPHGAMMPTAACVVCHGGMGVTQKALAAGVPVCVVPFGRDQFEVAEHVVAAGAGTMVPPDALTPEALRDAVLAAMDLRSGAERVARGFEAAGGAAAAADAVESLRTTARAAHS